MKMPDRFIYKSFQIDTNRINSRGGLHSMNQLERWREDGVIMMDMSEVAQEEAIAGGSESRAEKARVNIFSMTLAETPREQEQIRQIESILFPEGAEDQNQRNDVEIVFNALKYHRILVTADGGSKSQPGGMLGRRKELSAMNVQMMRDHEAVEYTRDEIQRRDDLAREIAAHTGQPVPDWVGKD